MDHFDQSIAALRETLREQEQKVVETKRLINALSEAAGRGPVFQDVDVVSHSTLTSIQPDTFYGQPLNTSIRTVLEMRKVAGLGPATVREIYETLLKGGFEFPRAKSEKSAMDSLRISLGKSSHTFHKLPNGSYGLLAWYPATKTSKGKAKTPVRDDELEDADAHDRKEGSHDEEG